MSILDTLIGQIAPHECLGCGNEGQILCAVCANKLVSAPELCYRCQKISDGFLTCLNCFKASHLHQVRVATTYAGHAKDLIWQLKLAGAQSAASIMTGLMAPLVKDYDANALIVPVPTATSRVRRRGYDQASLLARELSRRTRCLYWACLLREGQIHQHGALRQDRLSQLAGAFRVTGQRAIFGKRIILVDDVITTGATLEAAATVLSAAGAASIEAVVFARPQELAN